LIAAGEVCQVVLAVDLRGQIPAQAEFFGSAKIPTSTKAKMMGELTYIARKGWPKNPEKHKYFRGVHYVKIYGFRAFCYERSTGRAQPEVVVTVVVPKRGNGRLSDQVFTRAANLFHMHCERFGHG
jgi:hypothetical protein